MREWADFSVEAGESGGTRLVIHGNLLVSSIGALDRKLREWNGPVESIDLSASGEIDTAGAWVVWRFARATDARILGAGPQAQHLIATVQSSESSAEIRPPLPPIATRVPLAVGELVVGWGKGTVSVLGFLGELLIAIWRLLVTGICFVLRIRLKHPARLRAASLTRQLELVGVSALGIIGLMSFLIGIVIAQQGAVQLRQFGAEVFTINLIGRITLRELGVLMTAIMVAGRSGSAFAAQLGSMKLAEEVDAMRTIGVSPMEALILPRVLATVVLMPLLGFYSSLVAIVGGGIFCWISLDIPPATYIQRIREVVPITDLWVGLLKAPVFGAIVAMAGCFQGMQVKGNAEEVGLRTTAAVVQAIFLVIVLDAFFAVFFSSIGWV